MNVRIFTARKRSLRRLCFYRCLSVHSWGVSARGVSDPGGVWLRGVCSRWGGGVWSRGSGPGGGWDPNRDGYCYGRYASYWNAFLLLLMVKGVSLLSRGFHKLDEIGNTSIRGFTTWKKEITATKCYLLEVEPGTSDSKSDCLLSELTFHMLHRGSLNCLMFMHHFTLV